MMSIPLSVKAGYIQALYHAVDQVQLFERNNSIAKRMADGGNYLRRRQNTNRTSSNIDLQWILIGIG